MPSHTVGADPSVDPSGRPWRRAGLALLAVWAGLLTLAVVWWVDIAFFPGENEDVHGYIAVFGAPFVLVALVLLWWVWWSARALRRGSLDGWPALIVLGVLAMAQVVSTAQLAVAPPSVPGTPGVADAGWPPRELLAGLLVAICLGLPSVVVAVLGRRAWAPTR